MFPLLLIAMLAAEVFPPQTQVTTGVQMSKGSQVPVSPKASQETPIKHVVIILQENRTPDEMFQALGPNGNKTADISTVGICYQVGGYTPCVGANQSGLLSLWQTTMVNDWDIGHSRNAWKEAWRSGEMNHFNNQGCSGSAGTYCLGNQPYTYVRQADIQPYVDMALQYAFADRMFQTNQGPSEPAHRFSTWGTARIDNGVNSLYQEMDNTQGTPGCAAPPGTTTTTINQNTGAQGRAYPCSDFGQNGTLLEVMDANAISWKYYISASNGVNNLWTAPNALSWYCCGTHSTSGCASCGGANWTNHVVAVGPNSYSLSTHTAKGQILTDIQSCALPQVAFVMPSTLSSDHQGTDGSGPSWAASVVNAIGIDTGKCGYWSNTAIFVTWDDWGGYYDHVAPNIPANKICIPGQSCVDAPGYGAGPGIQGSGGNQYSYGFRVPLIAISKYAKPRYVSHVTHDFGSILSYIEHNFGITAVGSPDPTSPTWTADAAAAARGDFLLDMFDYGANNSFDPFETAQFHPIDAPLDAEWFRDQPDIKSPPPDDDLPGEELSAEELDAYEAVRARSAAVVRTAIEEQVSGHYRVVLQSDLSSAMPTGTGFTAKSAGKTFRGHVVTRPAKRWLRRGSLQLVFDNPSAQMANIEGVRTGIEHTVLGSKKKAIVGAAIATTGTFAFDDYAVDPFVGKKNAAFYLADAAVALTALWLQKGGEAKLPKGTVIELDMERRKQMAQLGFSATAYGTEKGVYQH